MIVSIRSLRKLGVLAVLLLVLGGCGGDDEPAPPATQPGTVSEEATAPSDTQTETAEPGPATETLPNDGNGTGTGESGAGGAGDEEAAQTLALFTGRNGAITPRKVRVPAFISIQVELRSKDGAKYALRFGDVTITAGGDLNSVSTTIDGLRPNEAITGVPTGPGNKVRISATAEPGP